MGIFFGDSKPKVSKDEFKKIRNALYGRGLSSKEINEVEKIFHGDLHESSFSDVGISDSEIDRGITWLKSHMSSHTFSPEQISIIEEELRKKL